jgi:hypothetical protein
MEAGSASSQDDNKIRQRKRDFKDWLKLDHPFSYAHYVILCRIIDPSRVNLPPSAASEDTLTLRDFIENLTKIRKTPPRAKAPFTKGGTFQHVLPVAVNKIIQHTSLINCKDPALFIRKAFHDVWLSYKFHDIPWSPVNSPNAAAHWNTWARFGGNSGSKLPNYNSLRPQEQQSLEAEQAVQHIMDIDADAPWNISDLSLQDLRLAINRNNRPDDYKVFEEKEAQNPSNYPSVNHVWVEQIFDIKNPLHRLALIISHIFSHLAPRINIDHGNPTADQIHTESRFKTYIDTCNWVKKDKKGQTDKAHIRWTLLPYIIGWYDKKSPFRKYYASHGKVGSKWSEKHSSSYLFLSFLTLLYPLSYANYLSYLFL